MRKLTTVLVGLLAVSALAAGGATALSVTDWDGTNDLSDTFDATNDTESVRVIGENVTNDTASVTVWGIDSNGNEVEVDTGSITTDEANGTYTDTYEYAGIDPTTHDQYKVNVSGDGADSLDIARVMVKTGSGGGGGFLGGGGLTPTTMAGGLLAALGVGVLGWSNRDDYL